jgi:hypothetical protein
MHDVVVHLSAAAEMKSIDATLGWYDLEIPRIHEPAA